MIEAKMFGMKLEEIPDSHLTKISNNIKSVDLSMNNIATMKNL